MRPRTAEQEALLRTWFAALFDAGFVGADWPVEHGGRADHHPLHDRIVSEEILRARAPRPVDQVNLAAHVLLHFGSEEQKSDAAAADAAAASTCGVSCSASRTREATSPPSGAGAFDGTTAAGSSTDRRRGSPTGTGPTWVWR